MISFVQSTVDLLPPIARRGAPWQEEEGNKEL